MGSGVSEKSPMRCWPELTPDPDPEERLGLWVRYQSLSRVAEGYKGSKPCLSLYPWPLSFPCTFQKFVYFCFCFITPTLHPHSPTQTSEKTGPHCLHRSKSGLHKQCNTRVISIRTQAGTKFTEDFHFAQVWVGNSPWNGMLLLSYTCGFHFSGKKNSRCCSSKPLPPPWQVSNCPGL